MPAARPAHRPSNRTAILDAAELHVRDGGTLTLDATARSAGISKPGLMYHFPSKEELATAVLDHVMDRYHDELLAHLVAITRGRVDDPAAASTTQRVLAYLEWACDAELGPADLIMFVDPGLRIPLTERWRERFDPWWVISDDVDSGLADRLLAIRLIADGIWFGGSSATLDLSCQDKDALRALARSLLAQEGDR